MNAVVKSWLYSTVTADLADAVIDHRATAYEAWIAIEDYFLGIQETRALHLDAKFRAFAQGDHSVTDYCKHFKKMVADLSEHVTDHTLVLNMICGLNERYRDIGVHLRRSRPFPSFAVVRNELLLEEINMVQTPSAPPTVLVATGSPSSRQSAPTSSGPPRPAAPKQKKKPKDLRTSSGDAPFSDSSSTPGTTGRRSSIRGSSPSKCGLVPLHPLQQQAFLPTQYQQQQAQYQQQQQPAQYQPMVGSPLWDQNSLASTFSTVTLTLSVNNDWYLDTGASSHMTPMMLIKNLISICQFTIDNNCSVEFDPYGCSVKDLLSRNVIIRCNSSGPLYPLQLPVVHSLDACSTSSSRGTIASATRVARPSPNSLQLFLVVIKVWSPCAMRVS
eukprot:XP_008676400.1 uncharacterized protein LOC103652638 [Zea mays]